MKQFLILIFSIFQITLLFSQTNFILLGKTNLVSNGKAFLEQVAPSDFYSTIIKIDTAQVQNRSFTFKGKIKHTCQFRLTFIGKDNDYMSETFFVDPGFQKILVDSLQQSHNFLDPGYRVLMEGSKTNDEYFKKYLPLFDYINKRIDVFFSETERCASLIDKEAKDCIIKTEIERHEIRRYRDSLLVNYTTHYPKSKIVSWLLYENVRRYGYNEFYQSAIDKINNYTPVNIIKSLKKFLFVKKTIAVGNKFPLLDFINANTPENYLQNNKYTLVEFWFSGCRPCLAQFNSLKSIFEEQKDKGFGIVAISVDKKDMIDEYQRVLKVNNYPWLQILDTSGKRAARINILKYPTTFLLDNSGIIINVDINPIFLGDFLEQRFFLKK